MKEMSIKEFWKSLDTLGKDKFRMAVVNATDVSPNTVDKYATGHVNPSVKKRAKMQLIAERDFDINLLFD